MKKEKKGYLDDGNGKNHLSIHLQSSETYYGMSGQQGQKH